MAVLSAQQRSTLEAAVKQARKIAEQGAFNALHAMAVDHSEPFAHMDSIQRKLRNSLRSKARLLGDEMKSNGEQQIFHLCYELAYESWHRMLFAKFLEANNLLMHPDGVAVTMEDCEELAKEEGYVDKWEAAANYASRMLPAIFRVEDPLMKVTYATEDRIKLESIIEGLENNIFVGDDSLGWVYQFWQSDAKAVINASGDKIDGDKLPAVTQLFTEPYMVHFLIDNTLGAWWVTRNPGIKPPVSFEYLRLLGDGTPAAGRFEGWPNSTAQVTALDPCMGSGHFVAALFPVFATLRMREEGLTKEEATDKVISENLHGLELDARCTQIAAFNLALTAWKFCGYYKILPEMNLACSGIGPKGRVEDWVKLVGKVDRADDKARMENGMKVLYQHFQFAPELGSLLEPTRIKADAFTARFEELQPVLKRALESEIDLEQLERGVMAAGIAKAGELLTNKYILQITNVPYLSRGKQDKVMLEYIEKNYKEAKNDLATVFLEKMLKANAPGGISCAVMPQNWLFLTSYKKLRENFLKNESWSFVIRLGAKAFQTPMWDFNVMLISLAHSKPKVDHTISGLDISEFPNAGAKAEALKSAEIKIVNQKDQLDNPDSRIVIDALNSNTKQVGFYATIFEGLSTGDAPRYIIFPWEISSRNNIWEYFAGASQVNQPYNAFDQLLRWENGNGALKKDPGAYIKGTKAWRKKGIRIAQVNSLASTLYLGNIFDKNGGTLIPKEDYHLAALYMYCSSDLFREEVRKIDQKLNVTVKTFEKVPFDLNHWLKVAAEKYPTGLPMPYSDIPTQWLFHGNPTKTANPLQVALARILGYRWPAENDSQIELADDARALIEAVKTFDRFSDEDGIFCIPSVNTEQAGAERLRNYLKDVLAKEWNNQTITQFLQKEGAQSANLESWLRDEFFIQHCKLFQNRPFIWHIWDGRKDGFSVLVNYHKLTKDNLSKLIYTYLGDWIRICESKKKSGESGAEGLLSAALKLKEKLEAILEGESPYDIFIRWKPIEQQPIGWEPDLNDGVRLNIRPFIEADVLRKKPNIKWGIDRGKNPPGSYWGVKRDNDKHLSLEEKRKSRSAIKEKK